MLTKDKRRAERRWRSFHAWMRRLQDDWWTHGSRLNPRGIYLHMKETGVCTIKRGDSWRDRYHCDCFDFSLQGNYRFKETPHPRCGFECHAEYSHGIESRPIQEWREEGRAYGDEGREDFHVRRREPDRMILVRQKCVCGFLMKTFWKRAEDISWGDKRSEDYCPGCEKRFGPRKGRLRMPA